jgi:hypothetical protein
LPVSSLIPGTGPAELAEKHKSIVLGEKRLEIFLKAINPSV